jgi:hypothetical protein
MMAVNMILARVSTVAKMENKMIVAQKMIIRQSQNVATRILSISGVLILVNKN